MVLTKRLASAWRAVTRARAARAWIVGLFTVGSVTLSLYWVFLVPIFEAPDEQVHLDYGLTIYNVGGLVNLRDRATFPYYGLSDPLTSYLERATGFLNVQYQSNVGVESNYGQAAYYRAIDQNAPTVPSNFVPSKNPSVVFYPFGYYLLLAGWLAFLAPLKLGVVGMFFSARILSVLLLAVTLPLTYLVALELKAGRGLALALTGVIGFLPLTSFVSSYVQPDNLSLTLVTLCIYLALRARRSSFGLRWMFGLGLALGALLVTKYHFFACVALPTVAMLVTERLFAPRTWARLKLRPLRMLAVALPSVALGALQVWILASSQFPYLGAVSKTASVTPVSSTTLSQAISGGPVSAVVYVAVNLGRAFENYYTGITSRSFWGWFGWLDAPLQIRSPGITMLVQGVVIGTTILMFVLMLVRVQNVVARLLMVARRGRWRWALRIACANPFLNSYFIFTIFMFGLFVITNGTFFPQGRNWFPYLLPALSVGAIYAPKVLSKRRTRAQFSTLVVGGLALYCIVAGYYSVRTVQERYYAQEIRVSSFNPSAGHLVSSGFGMQIRSPYGTNWPNVPEGSYIYVTGWAVNSADASPAGAVVASIDHSLIFPGVYGIAEPEVVNLYHQPAYLNSGFSITFSTNGLALGHHILTVDAVTKDGSAYYESPYVFGFDVVA